MMDDRMVDRRPADPDDLVTDVDRPGWEPPTNDDDDLVRREPIDDRTRWGEPQYAPGPPNDGDAKLGARSDDEGGAVGGAVVGGAAGAIAGGAIAGPPGALVGAALGAVAGLAAGDGADHADDVPVDDGGA
jgi:hypothetical protein